VRRRFFVTEFRDGRAELRGDAAHHAGRVLRVECGQQFELSDGQQVWLASVDAVARERIQFVLRERVEGREPSLHTTLLLSIVKFDRLEWALEKATELGVAQIVPLAAARSDKMLRRAAAKRAVRWRKILLESAQQARRLRVPELLEIMRPAAAFAAMKNASVKLLLSEERNAPELRDVLGGATGSSAALAIGPEGGWTEDEFAAARTAGFRAASLGPTIVRTETAVVAALASLNYALGEKKILP
jgi:16S rRNA (uracil1498-N3)-methyltransferase